MKYPIHDTILRIVANLLTTKFFGGFLIQMHDNCTTRTGRHQMRGIEQQHDVYLKSYTIRISYRLGRHVYNKRGKHTDKRYRNMQ